MRRSAILAALLVCLLLLSVSPARAFAGDAQEASPPPFVDDEELSAIVEQALEESIAGARLYQVPLSVAVLFTRSGETWYYHADEWYYTASLYKLPMIMRFSRMLEDGELEDVPAVFREQGELIKERCLVYSDNSWASALWRNVFTRDGDMARAALDFSHFPEEELPADYFSSLKYSARFTLGILQELYEHPDRYPGVLDYMRQAQPRAYFRHELEGKYEVAQKYGSADGYNHTAGIVWTPSPILLVIMSNHLAVQLGDETIGHVAAAVADYALLVDDRADRWEARQCAEALEAAAEASAEPEIPSDSPAPAQESEPAEAAPADPVPRNTGMVWALLFLLLPLGGVLLWRLTAGKRA